MFLDENTFATVIASTPLIAIDLIVVNEKNELLLGKRLNRPAKNFWFVPGGRILKNETLDNAFKRLTSTELGKEIELKQAKLLGVFEHFYQDSVFSEQASTHYVNTAHVLYINSDELASLPLDDQHDKYQWHAIDEVTSNPDIHHYTKAYLITYESQSFYKNTDSTVIRHLGRDCRDPEFKDGMIV